MDVPFFLVKSSHEIQPQNPPCQNPSLKHYSRTLISLKTTPFLDLLLKEKTQVWQKKFRLLSDNLDIQEKCMSFSQEIHAEMNFEETKRQFDSRKQ